jgi:hypothetical protein
MPDLEGNDLFASQPRADEQAKQDAIALRLQPLFARIA